MPRLIIAVLFLGVALAGAFEAGAQDFRQRAREIARDQARPEPERTDRVRREAGAVVESIPEGQEARRWFWQRRAENRGDRLAQWRQALEARRAEARQMFDVDPVGRRTLRRQVLALDPSDSAIARAKSLNFAIEREQALEGIDARLLVLAPPGTIDASEALAILQAADPEGVYALNHVFEPSGARGEAAPAPSGGASAPAADVGADVRIGMIDAGVDLAHPALARASVVQRAFPAQATAVPAPHGTAVASLLVGQDGAFTGALPRAQLFAADVFTDRPDGGSAETIALALSWLAGSGVEVVNMSLAGPANPVLEAVCRKAAQRGVAIVAAVGNNGPTAPVAFPAAYPDVIAVTAIDERRRIYPVANRGPEVDFAATGVSVRAALDQGGYAQVSGTSFAAPLVAARLARVPAHQRTIELLARTAQDLGDPGRDPVYGFGAL